MLGVCSESSNTGDDNYILALAQDAVEARSQLQLIVNAENL